jgi:beta-glucosidase
MMKRILYIFLMLATLLAGCGSPTPAPTLTPAATETPAIALYKDPSQAVNIRVEDLLSRMTLEEKIGQMTQVEHNSLAATPEDVTGMYIGSVLSGGGSLPSNRPIDWRTLVEGFQERALATRLGIPLIYGIDAVHGHGHVYGATIFPHNIGLGAANDPALMEKIGQITAQEILVTGIPWNFAPVIAVPQDTRWGRAYEGYGESTGLVSSLGTAYMKGLQAFPEGYTPSPGQTIFVLATPKHFIGDGGTKFGTSVQNVIRPYLLDQGDVQMDEAALRALFLPPYKAAIDTGAQSIMVSFSSWNGTKMSASKFLLTDVLKNELGFKGFLISDWGSIDQISSDYYSAVVTSINAGMDMSMVPYDYKKFISALKSAVEKGDIPMQRIDDAVRRILAVKFALGLFEQPYTNFDDVSLVGSDAHRAVAREAVQKSLVLLKNEDNALPLAKDAGLIFVAGQAANNIGLQSGGWTIEWQGLSGPIQVGTTILDGIEAAVTPDTRVEYNRFGRFESVTDDNGNPAIADVSIVVVSEEPYAEGVGDNASPALSEPEAELIENMRLQSKKLVVIIISGRPLMVTPQLPKIDALVAAWLPGTEGAGVADVLFGDVPFTGKLPYSWQRTNEQMPINVNNAAGKNGCEAPLFAFGYGLSTGDPSPVIPECP